MIQETNEAKSDTKKKGNYYITDTKWYVSLASADITLRPMNEVSDRPLTPAHLASVLCNIRSIGDTKGDACTVASRVDFDSGNVSFFHYFMDGGCDKELRGKIFSELKSVPISAIKRNGSEDDLNALFNE